MALTDKFVQGAGFTVAVLGEIYFKQYSGPMEKFVHWYAHDITLPFGLYFFNKLIGNVAPGKDLANTCFCFLGASFLETLQFLGVYRGNFDPKDFLAYAAGAGLALAVDKLTSRKSSIETLIDAKVEVV